MDLKFTDLNTTHGNAVTSSDPSKSSIFSDATRGKISDSKEIQFDSGILVSEADILQSSSEIDIISSGPSEYESTSDLLTSQEFHEGDSFSSCKCQGGETDEMGLRTMTDSGIYTEESDRVTDSTTKKHWKHSSSKSVPKSCRNNSFSWREPAEESNLNLLLEQINDDGDTLLHVAIIQKNENTIKKFLQQIPSSSYLDIQNYYHQQTCLHLSVLMNLPHMTRLLFLAGARTDIEDINGDTALHLACQTNHLECVTALLSPVTVHERDISFRYKPILDWSTKYLNEYNYDGLSCLHLAAVYDDCRVLNQLFKYGADVNIRECKGGYTILHKAVESGNKNLVRCILQQPAIGINNITYARQTAYELSSHYPTIRQLLLIEGSESYVSAENAESSSDEDTDSEEYDSE